MTIVVRTKDRPRLLARALDDVLAQTLHDWEVVVVNDGGDAEVVDTIVAQREDRFDGRCRTVHHRSSLGMEIASNRGVAAGTGEYVAIHDDDDTWAATFLDQTVSALDSGAEFVGVAVPTQVVIERVTEDAIEEIDRWMFVPPGDIVTVFDLLLSNRVVPIGLLVRRAALEAVGGFDERLPVVGDWEFNLRLALHGHIHYLVGEPLAYWRQRPEHESGSLANSVFDASDLHFRYDRLVRERALVAEAREHGLGTVLYLSKYIDERIGSAEQRVHARIDALESAHASALNGLRTDIDRIVHQHVQYHSPAATVRRAIRRLLPWR